MNVVCYEFGLIWTGLKQTGLLWIWSVTNVVCSEGGLLRMWSLMNVVCNERVINEQAYYECGLQWTGHR